MFICDKYFDCCNYKFWDTVEDIDDPGATECGHLVEVAPVIHAHWIKEWICSHCGEVCAVRVCGKPLKICINCFAIMDEDPETPLQDGGFNGKDPE